MTHDRVQRGSTDRSGALTLRSVTKRYPETVAVDDVSLEVAPGEFLTLLGPSGSGKTTTLRIIAGFVPDHEGGVNLDGQELAGRPPYKRDVGMVFQNYALFPHMSARENIAFPLRMRNVSKREVSSRVDEALELVHLEGMGKRYPRQLSGGQQQRVAVARAIVFGPRVLLMDEPLGALDKKLREFLQLEIMRISRQLGVTVVYVTHDQEEALVMSDRIAIYNQGRIEQIGTGEDLYERPSSRFVADFVGESNIFGGTVRQGDAGPELVSGRWVIATTERQLHAADVRHGQRAAIVVRPERTHIRAVDTADAAADCEEGMTALPGVVRESMYLGPVRKYVVDLPDGTEAIARVSLEDDHRAPLANDQQVLVSWHTDSGVVVRDAQAGEASPKLPTSDEPVDQDASA